MPAECRDCKDRLCRIAVPLIFIVVLVLALALTFCSLAKEAF